MCFHGNHCIFLIVLFFFFIFFYLNPSNFKEKRSFVILRLVDSPIKDCLNQNSHSSCNRLNHIMLNICTNNLLTKA